MAEYIACVLGDNDHIVSFWTFICDTDASATVWAKQRVNGHDVKLWSGERLVTRIEAKKFEPSRTDKAREVIKEHADDQQTNAALSCGPRRFHRTPGAPRSGFP